MSWRSSTRRLREWRLFLSTQNNAPAGGRGELVALANGGVQLNALNQFISLNTTSGIANLAVEPNTGGSSNGEVIFGYGHLNASDRRLKTNIRRVPEQHVQRLFEAVEPQYYDRIGGGINSASSPRTCRPPGSWARACARP